MGNQVNFYMMPEDEDVFLRFVASEPNVIILYATPLDRPIVPAEFPLVPASAPYHSRLALWSKTIATETEITPPARVKDRDHASGVFDVNAYLFPVIEVMRSVFRRDGLSPGRIWVETNKHRYADERKRALRSWFGRLSRWLNKLPYRCAFYRIGPKAKEYFDAGGTAIGYPGRLIATEVQRASKVSRRDPSTARTAQRTYLNGARDDV